ncbi:hypothetical protein Scani_57840 [Streptomyces caniferus]|uniref:Uncharacterized protein n=1 Tax=Streptomyces caniferus TaxID=285557 RepID=A0A640SGI9_9ACTN|nr:hypothetical protein Scani_57840 [Streptomyces caniferus]
MKAGGGGPSLWPFWPLPVVPGDAFLCDHEAHRTTYLHPHQRFPLPPTGGDGSERVGVSGLLRFTSGHPHPRRPVTAPDSPAQRTPPAAGATATNHHGGTGKAQRTGNDERTASAGDTRRATHTAAKPKTWETYAP